MDTSFYGNALYTCMIPTITRDYMRMHLHYKRIFRHLPVKQITFVGPADLEDAVNNDVQADVFEGHPVSYINENDLLAIDKIRPVFNSLITPENNLKPTAVNWYYQQFLKMAFSLVCKDEYYLCWDSDTVPLRHIEMFSPEGKPYFDVKPEFNESYFVTIERLFGFSKIIEKSFVAEHMIFNVSFMKDMIKEIENTDYQGSAFYEKILYAVGSDNLNQGFSEFETFGSWVGMHHSSAYKLREWRSFRNTNFFTDISEATEEDFTWLSKDYDAATFEKYQETSDVLNQLFRDPRYREKLSPKQFYTSVLESGIFGEYVDGAVVSEDFNAPA
ncbi:MAG: DUF6492 family protein [Butyrivibrio sp.]|nr:DUF6492 family protein [Butyrivibrio sp.]